MRVRDLLRQPAAWALGSGFAVPLITVSLLTNAPATAAQTPLTYTTPSASTAAPTSTTSSVYSATTRRTTAPTPPRQATATALKDAIRVTWKRPSNIPAGRTITYQVYLRTYKGAWNTVDCPPTATTCTIKARSGIKRQARVQALTRGGASAPTITKFATPYNVTTAPEKLRGTPVAQTGRVRLAWNPPTNNRGAAPQAYVIQQRTTGNWTTATTRPTTTTRAGAGATTTAIVENLNPDTAYQFRVAAENKAGRSRWSNPTTTTTYNVPGPVTDISGSGSGYHIYLTWNPPANAGGTPVTGYDIDFSTDGTTWSTAATNQLARSYIKTGLQPGRTYYVRIAAVNAIGSGTPTVKTVTTDTPPAPITPPSPPVVTAAERTSDTSILVIWDPPTSDGGAPIQTYEVRWAPTATMDWEDPVNTGNTQTQYEVTGLQPVTEYEFEVAAVTSADTTWAEPVIAVTYTTADAPTNPAASRSGDATITVTWDAPTFDGGNPITSYDITYTTDSGATWYPPVNTTTDVTTYPVTGLINGTSYIFVVTAINDAGLGPDSADSNSAVPYADLVFDTGYTTIQAETGEPTSAQTPTVTGGYGTRTYTITPALPDGLVLNSVTGELSGTPTATAPTTTYTVQVDDASTGTNTTTTVTITVQDPVAFTAGYTQIDQQVNTPITAQTPTVINGYAPLTYTITPTLPDGLVLNSVTGEINGTPTELHPTTTHTVTVTDNANWTDTTTLDVTVYTTPSAPGDISATKASNTSIAVSFTPGFDGYNPITSYTATCASNDGGDPGTNSGAMSPITVTTLTTGKTYTCSVYATNTAGNSPSSSDSSAVVTANPPGTVQTLAGVPGDTTVDLSWTAPASDGGAPVLSYTVTVSPTEGTVTYPDPRTNTTASVTGLVNGVTYTFTVTATNAAGTGTGTSTTATPRTTPDQVTGLTATAGNQSVDLSWTAPASDGGAPITDYTINYATDPTGPWTTYADGTSTSTSTSVTGLTSSTTYYFRVAAVNIAGTGPWSANATATPYGEQAFSYIGATNQTFTVPTGVTSITVDMAGGQGGASGRAGSRLQTTLTVTPGQTLILRVAQQGQGLGYQCTPTGPFSSPGGWPGGGSNGDGQLMSGCKASPGSGGGYSGIFNATVSHANALAIAGGGGTNATPSAGGTNGGNGGDGTGSAGGSRGTPDYSNASSAGSALQGGNGGFPDFNSYPGGGGGGGYYGGGGGGGGSGGGAGGGGGTGSSYSAGTSTTITTGYQSGNGYITIRW